MPKTKDKPTNSQMKPWTATQDWQRFLKRSSTQTPRKTDESVQEKRLIWAYKKMNPEEKNSLTIKKEDLMDGGKY